MAGAAKTNTLPGFSRPNRRKMPSFGHSELLSSSSQAFKTKKGQFQLIFLTRRARFRDFLVGPGLGKRGAKKKPLLRLFHSVPQRVRFERLCNSRLEWRERGHSPPSREHTPGRYISLPPVHLPRFYFLCRLDHAFACMHAPTLQMTNRHARPVPIRPPLTFLQE